MDYTQPLFSVISGFEELGTDVFNSPPLLVDEGLRTPYVQSWFAGVQRQLNDRWYLEISQMGSLGRKLITSDLVNQAGSAAAAANARARINGALPALWFRSNHGSSSYTGLGALARYRTTHADFQASYTWSHTLDNQSDAMLGDPFGLSRFNPENAVSAQIASQFDARLDRGSADFDIQHSLVFYSIWRLPVPGGWELSQLADFRTGLPYTPVYLQDSPDVSIQNRPDAVAGTRPNAHDATDGGVQLLNPKAFSFPAARGPGTLGRNTFTGPGFWNIDLSLAKSFSLGESPRLQFRADAFNLFNHANLGMPDTIAGFPDPSAPGRYFRNGDFGRALYGPQSNAAAFPALTPLYPSPRRIQLQVKLYF
jgi:hypothetical protein